MVPICRLHQVRLRLPQGILVLYERKRDRREKDRSYTDEIDIDSVGGTWYFIASARDDLFKLPRTQKLLEDLGSVVWSGWDGR